MSSTSVIDLYYHKTSIPHGTVIFVDEPRPEGRKRVRFADEEEGLPAKRVKPSDSDSESESETKSTDTKSDEESDGEWAENWEFLMDVEYLREMGIPDDKAWQLGKRLINLPDLDRVQPFLDRLATIAATRPLVDSDYEDLEDALGRAQDSDDDDSDSDDE